MNKWHLISKKVYEDYISSRKHGLLNLIRYENLKIPKRATRGSACYDMYIPFDLTLTSTGSIVIPTFIKAELDVDKVIQVYPKSGLGFKYKLQLANTVGIIDSDYYNNSDNEGHIMIKIINNGTQPIYFKAGDKFCQAMINTYNIMDDDSWDIKNWEGIERNGGFGSTGK